MKENKEHKEISKKYKVLSEVEHVLNRPGMYIGSTKRHDTTEHIFNGQKFESKEITYIPGFLKIFDEIISNSVDESKRNSNLNQIIVKVDKKTISIRDNGGIPVVKHTEHNKWIPEIIFSQMRAGSNFDDTEKRVVAGTHGYGSTLTNIFSLRFTVVTADGKNQFEQTFSDNMSNRSAVKITPSNKNFTEISFDPDVKRFGLTEIDEDHLKLIQKRVIDIAGCNHNLKVSFNGNAIKFKTFKEYAELYTDDIFYERSENWEIGVGHSLNGHKQISFVNTVETKDGGTHVNYILNQIVEKLKVILKKKHKVEIKPSDIKNHMLLFVNCAVVNSGFSSQTKEKLITEVKEFGTSHEVSDKLIKQIFDSEIIKSILDWIDKKEQADEKALLRKVAKDLSATKINKLIDAKSRTDRHKCSLALFEGDSPMTSVRTHRDANLFGAFPLRGKFLNVNGMKPADILKNVEAKSIIGAMGLRIGEKAENLRYGKILIYVDADCDGSAISSLLTNFFFRFWPELFKEGRIYQVLTPIVVAKKGKESLNFYKQEEYSKWEKTNSIKGWSIEYKKGLAALEDSDYKDIIQNPQLLKIEYDDLAKESLDAWFGNDSTPRKLRLMK